MGTHSYAGQCPQCGSNKFDVWEDIHEIHTISGFCDLCGYKYWNETGQADLEEVNKYRQGADDKPLTQLRKPMNANGYMTRASNLAANNEHDLAIADYAEAIRLDPDDAFSYFYRADSFMKLGRFEEAVRDYTTFIQREPDSLGGYMFRARALRAMGDEDGAIRDEKKVKEFEAKTMK